MTCRPLYRSLAITVGLALSAMTAAAQVGGFTATFRDRVATGNPSENFDVWVRLTLDANAAPFNFDANDVQGNFGLPSYLLPTIGSYTNGNQGTFAQISSAFAHADFACSGTFTSDCTIGPPYTFSLDGSPWFGSSTLHINPGENFDYLLGSFAPDGGNAPAGTYRFYGAFAGISFVGQDANGDELKAGTPVAQTCGNGFDDSCAFIRTITTLTPEPKSWVLLIPALAGVLLLRRRRSC